VNSFVAMLKDSYKEAVDGWIFAVMLGLAGVLILLVASSSVAPLPADVAVPKMLVADGPLVVKQGRGAGPKQAIFLFRPQVSEATAPTGDRPWDAGVTFTVSFAGDGGGFGAAGVEVELGEDRKPKAGTDVQQMLILGDPFQEAVRYWATEPGGEKPAYSEALAKEFVASFVADTAGLTVSSVAPAPPPKPKDDGEPKKKKKGGGMFGGFFGGGPKPPPTFAVACGAGDRLRWAHQASFLFGAWTPQFKQAPLGRLVYQLENTLLNGVGAWVLLLAGVIVTAGFIPNMLRKGAIDLLLTKPVSRPLILFYKYLGGLLFVFLLTAVAVGGVWLAVGLRTGVWATGLLGCVAGITFYFAILYACSTLAGVLTRNAIVSIVLTIVFWFVVWLIGTVYGFLNIFDTFNTLGQASRGGGAVQVETKDKDTGEPKAEVAPPPAPADGGAKPPTPPVTEPAIPVWLVTTFKYANMVTPRTGDLDDLTTRLVARDLLSQAELRSAGVLQKEPQWAEVLGVAGGWIVLLLGLATLRFVTRSY
jgi:ABC-type transport system involved in multi-copper enzyme maturation permease subunit